MYGYAYHRSLRSFHVFPDADQFLKAQAQNLIKLPVVPKEIYSAIKANPARGWFKFENVNARTDLRIWSTGFLTADIYHESGERERRRGGGPFWAPCWLKRRKSPL